MAFKAETVWEFGIVPNVKVGNGAATELDSVAKQYAANSILIITDQGLVDAGIARQVEEAFDGVAEVSTFSDVNPDPSREVFDAARKTANDVSPDLVVGLGGGSSLDVAKVTGALHHGSDDLLDYVAPPTGGGAPVPKSTLPTVNIPTTAGTGSETSPVAVVSLPEERMKVGISSQSLVSDLAVIDPGLTVSLPPEPTAFSGVDALSHAVEAYITRPYDANPRPESPAERPDYGGRTQLTDLFAHRAIELITNNLRTAVNDGTNIKARKNMCMASFMAGAAFTNAGLGAVHAMAMATGARHDVPHGQSIAAVLPTVIQFNATTSVSRCVEIAQLFGENVNDLRDDEAAQRAGTAISTLLSDIGVETDLSSLGVTEEDVEPLVTKTLKLKRLLAGNPKRIDENAMRELYQSAL